MNAGRVYNLRQQSILPIVVIATLLAGLAWGVAPRAAYAATITVQSAGDGAATPGNCPGVNCRLRDAIAAASNEDTIDFSLTYPATITLTSGDLVIGSRLTISGPGVSSLTLSGGGNWRVLSINATGVVTVTDLAMTAGAVYIDGSDIYNNGTLTLITTTVTGGVGGYGGGIYNDTGGVLTLDNSTVSDNTSGSGNNGGGVLNMGTLTLQNNTVVENNTATGPGTANGGGIGNGGTVTVINSAIRGNTATAGVGGGIWHVGSQFTLDNATLANNSASGNGSDIYNAATMNQTGAISVTGNIHQAAGGTFSGSGDTIDLNGNLTIAGGTFTAPSGTFYISGTLNHSGGTFTANGGTVNFDGAGVNSIVGATTFYTLMVNGGATLALPTDASATALVNNGTITQTQTVNGTSDVVFAGIGNYGGVVINANGVDLGATSVVIKGNQTCYPGASSLIRRCFDIVPANTTGLTATVAFYYADNELNGFTCADMNVYHWNGTGWDAAYSDPIRTCGSEPYSVQVAGVTDFTPFGLTSGTPTSVTLQSLVAHASQTGIPVGLALVVFGMGGLALAWRTQRRTR